VAVSIFDLFKIGIGPSSSHTVGPMRAANQFVTGLQTSGSLQSVARITSEMYGSLGATGKGHGTAKAVLLGLEGDGPETVVVSAIASRVASIRESCSLNVAGTHRVRFDYDEDLTFYRKESLPFHPNGMVYKAYDANGEIVSTKTYFSVGGGFVVDEAAVDSDSAPIIEDDHQLPYGFTTGAEMLMLCRQHNMKISDLMWENEKAWRSEEDVRSGLMAVWDVMQDCVKRGCVNEGELPGGLKVARRASDLYRSLLERPEASLSDPLTVLDWVTLYALAVNEENAAGGRVVTAPTNGAAGIIPAVAHYFMRFTPGASDEDIVRFLLTAGAIGILYKENASISGAEVGCQGEVGSACSMAAGALAEVLGGTPEQVENAAEIAMEHNLGLTCDPIGGLVQVPCIERNAMASIKAISAARMALRGDGTHFVSLDKVIKTMRDTGRDMQEKYKETARGGLAVNVIEVPVNIIDC